MNCGQTCIRPDYVLVHSSVADRFMAELEKTVGSMYGQDPKKSDYFGRVINVRAHERLMSIIEDARTKGKCVVRFGGASAAEDRYIAPTLLDYGTDEIAFAESLAMSDEIFGPILPILRYSKLEQAMGFVQVREKPLALYAFTTDATQRERILTETSAGNCNVNDVMMHMCNPELPFGGVGKSGMGCYHGKFSFEAFTHKKAVLFKTNYMDVPARYPPYVSWKVFAISQVQKVRPAWQWKVLRWVCILIVLWIVRRLRFPSDGLVWVVRLIFGQGGRQTKRLT